MFGVIVVCEVFFLENFNKCVFVMILDGIGIVNICWSLGFFGCSSWRRVVCKVSKNVLLKRFENVGICIDVLWISC